MSTQSPQAKAAGENVSQQAGWMNQLGGVAIPEFQMLMGGGGQTGLIPGMLAGAQDGRLPGDIANLTASTNQLNQGYRQAGFGLGQTIGYGGLRSGEGRVSPGAMNASLGSAATTLERQRQGALANLNFMSAQASMADYNKLLGLMGQGTQAALGLSQGFTGISNQALRGMDPSSDMDKILQGVGTTLSVVGKVV